MRILTADSFTIGAIPFGQFQQACGGFELTDALTFIQYEAAAMGNQILKKVDVQSSTFGSGWIYITPETNSFISKHLLLNSSFLLARRPFRRSDYEKLIIYFNHLERAPGFHDLNPQNPDARRIIIREIYTQARYQRIFAHILGRYYILFNELEQSKVCNHMTEKATGFRIDEIMLIGTSFYATILHNKYLDIQHLEKHAVPKLDKVLQPEKLRRFLRQAAISQDRFRSEYNRMRWDDPLFMRYEFNPLWLYPIIDTGIINSKSRYIVPSIDDLVYRCTEGIYYSAMDYYCQGGRINDFSTAFGPLFQDYIGCLLRDVRKKNRKPGTIQPETEYRLGANNWKSADWLVVSADNVTQIECQKITTSVKFRAAISDSSASDFDATLDRLADEVVKLYKKSSHIKQNRLRLRSQRKIAKVFSVLVAMDELYLIDSIFKKQITTKATRRKVPANFKYHILGCTDFELLCEFLKTHPQRKLTDVLELKERDEHYYVNFHDFLEKAFEFQCYKIALLQDASDKLFASVIPLNSS